MKVIAQKLWNEPAAVIGLLVTIGLLIVNLIGDTEWSGQEVIEVLAPFATGIGVRQLVTPAKTDSRDGTTYQRLEPR